MTFQRNCICIVGLIFFCFIPFLVETQDSSNWLQSGHDPQHTGFSASKGPDASTLLWDSRISKSYWWGPPTIISSPLVAREMLFVVPQSDKRLYAISVYTGKIIWSLEIGRDNIFDTPAISEDLIFIQMKKNNKSFLCAFNIFNGQIKWEIEIPSNLSSITISGGYIYYASNPVIALSEEDGKRIWDTSKNKNSEDYGFGLSAPTISEKYVLVNLNHWRGTESYLHCFDILTGGELWKYDTQVGMPGVFNDKVFVLSMDKLLALNANDGKIIWEFDIGGDYGESIVIGYNSIFLSTNKGTLHSINLFDGSENWKVKIDTSGNMALADRKVFIASISGLISVISIENGKLLWNHDIGELIYSLPIVAEGILFIATDSGRVYAFSTDSEAFLRQGDEFFDAGEYQKAQEAYNKAVDLFSENNDAEGVKKIETKIKRIKIITTIECLKEKKGELLLVGIIITIVISYLTYKRIKGKKQLSGQQDEED